MNMNNEIQILLEKSRKIQEVLPDYVKGQYVPPSQEENEQKKMVREFNRGDSLAPLIGTICDQEIDTDTAWSIPFIGLAEKQGYGIQSKHNRKLGGKRNQEFSVGFYERQMAFKNEEREKREVVRKYVNLDHRVVQKSQR